jgi:histidinol-phosphate/aromatic aminotransferase/cobyric acid decarboxylase-like protein
MIIKRDRFAIASYRLTYYYSHPHAAWHIELHRPAFGIAVFSAKRNLD